jgi:hypothetical protein
MPLNLTESLVGREALNTRIGQLQEHFGGLSFIVNGSIEHHNGYAFYQWAQPATAKSDEVLGWDVLHFDGDVIDRAVKVDRGGHGTSTW